MALELIQAMAGPRAGTENIQGEAGASGSAC